MRYTCGEPGWVPRSVSERVHYADAAQMIGVCAKMVLGPYVRHGVLPPPDALQTFAVGDVERVVAMFAKRREDSGTTHSASR